MATALELWREANPEPWQAALDAYWDRIRGLNKDRLEDLDRWFQEDLPAALKERKAPLALTKDELVKVVDWKMTREKWRPRLLDMTKELAPSAVEAATRAGFAVLAGHKGAGPPPEPVVKAAMAELTVLKGIGPATATAIMQAVDPSIPFQAAQAMLAALGSKDYTVAKALQCMAALRCKAAALSAAGGRQWTAVEVERALHSAAISAAAAAGGSGSGKKRKR